jgi:hypothetical protein
MKPSKLGARLRAIATETLVRAAAVLTLLSLVLMAWSVLDPTPMPVMVSMSVGQAIGTLALLLYVAAVIVYQLRLRREPRAPVLPGPERSRAAADDQG